MSRAHATWPSSSTRAMRAAGVVVARHRLVRRTVTSVVRAPAGRYSSGKQHDRPQAAAARRRTGTVASATAIDDVVGFERHRDRRRHSEARAATLGIACAIKSAENRRSPRRRRGATRRRPNRRRTTRASGPLTSTKTTGRIGTAKRCDDSTCDVHGHEHQDGGRQAPTSARRPSAPEQDQSERRTAASSQPPRAMAAKRSSGINPGRCPPQPTPRWLAARSIRRAGRPRSRESFGPRARPSGLDK